MRRWLVGLLLVGVVAVSDADSPSLSAVFQGYVRNGKVDYAGIRQNRRKELQAFVQSLANADVGTLKKAEQVAFWLNAYNGLVVSQIVENQGTPESVFSRGGFFRKARYQVAGAWRSLDDIEHKALRPLAQDPRIHFVLVCGAQSCPPLRASAFLGSQDLEESLEQAAFAYINDPDKVSLDRPNHRLILNKIFDWYAQDFGDVVQFVARYRTPEERAWLTQGPVKVEFRDYDWHLNQAR